MNDGSFRPGDFVRIRACDEPLCYTDRYGTVEKVNHHWVRVQLVDDGRSVVVHDLWVDHDSQARYLTDRQARQKAGREASHRYVMIQIVRWAGALALAFLAVGLCQLEDRRYAGAAAVAAIILMWLNCCVWD